MKKSELLLMPEEYRQSVIKKIAHIVRVYERPTYPKKSLTDKELAIHILAIPELEIKAQNQEFWPDENVVREDWRDAFRWTVERVKDADFVKVLPKGKKNMEKSDFNPKKVDWTVCNRSIMTRLQCGDCMVYGQCKVAEKEAKFRNQEK